MRVIRPVTITENELVNSSVPEDDYPAYSPATDYPVNDHVIYGHMVYKSVDTPNVGNIPGTTPLYWQLVGPTNRWLMFDQEVSTRTVADGSIVATIAPGLVNSLALLDLIGAHVNVTVTDGPGGPELYNREYPLDGSEVYDWYQYFYQPFIPVRQVVLTDLPLYGSANITATLTGGGQVAIGSMIAGAEFYLGELEYGANAGILSFSKKDTNQSTGVTRFRKGRNSKRMGGTFMLDNFAFNNTHRVLSDLDAVPVVWIGTDAAGYEPLIIYGFYRDFSIVVSYPTKSLCSIEIEGLA